MKLFSYKVVRDYGFAPNPFFGICSLATCKPRIREAAEPGDWVLGVGSSAKSSTMSNRLIYAMKVQYKITFDEYWTNPVFKDKKPVMNGSMKLKYGDNIYMPENGNYRQIDSHHSLANGKVNFLNYNRDLQSHFVLLSRDYWYWGGDAIEIPEEFYPFFCVNRNHIVFDAEAGGDQYLLINDFIQWISTYPEKGIIGFPYKFNSVFERYDGK